jgi:glycosyltransferase involved in cell wall biosynthesis
VNQRILVIVPAFNECGNIQRTIRELLAVKCSVDILVINDASTDDTVQEALELIPSVISLPYNLGIGGAVQTGFLYAVRFDYDIAVQVDGDGQHDASYLETILAPVSRGEVDIVIGSRFIKPFLGYRSSLIRRIGIQFFACLISLLTKCKVTDPTSGFRAYNARAIALFAEYYPTDYPEPESIVVAQKAGLRVVEVPVEMRKRRAGHSSIRYLNTLQYMIKVTFAIILCLCKSKKRIKT